MQFQCAMSLYFDTRRKAHQKVVLRMIRIVGTITAFVLIFSTLFLLSNWSAYSKIIFTNAPAEVVSSENTVAPQKPPKELKSSFVALQRENSLPFEIADVGKVAPDDFRLEVPKVFEGSIPVRQIEDPDFTFQNYYESENKIQKALRKGVVHYPFTATPDQYGNVFITGHSSYLPWDGGEYKDIFALLSRLSPGDEYRIFYRSKTYRYQIQNIFEIDPKDISVLEQPTDKKTSTLMTCTPVGTTLRRLVVQASLIDEL